MPIVVLGGKSGEDDRMLFLELGGETKQLSPRELLARVQRVMEQLVASANGEAVMATDSISFGDVRVNFARMEAHLAGRPVMMTANEFKIVRYFAKHPEKVISREELLNELWGYQRYPSTRTVDNHIMRLRHKLEIDPARPQYFLTMHGAGYKFVPDGICWMRCG
jgi:DNA-binding response OmpR family regulator